MTAVSVHDLKGTKRETKPPAGYKIVKDQKLVALVLQFFTNNRLENDPGDR